MPSLGMDRNTGLWLSDWPLVVQSIGDLVTTYIGTRVFRRAYGAAVPNLVDTPTNQSSILAFYVAFATALAAWEPRYQLKTVQFTKAGADGVVGLALTGTFYPNALQGDFTPATGVDRSVVLALPLL